MRAFGIGFFASMCLVAFLLLAMACSRQKPAANNGTPLQKTTTESAERALELDATEPQPSVEVLEQGLARLRETADRMEQKRSDLAGSTESLQQNLLNLIEIVANDAERQSAYFERTLQGMTFQLADREKSTPEAVSVKFSEPDIFTEPSLNLDRQEN